MAPSIPVPFPSARIRPHCSRSYALPINEMPGSIRRKSQTPQRPVLARQGSFSQPLPESCVAGTSRGSQESGGSCKHERRGEAKQNGSISRRGMLSSDWATQDDGSISRRGMLSSASILGLGVSLDLANMGRSWEASADEGPAGDDLTKTRNFPIEKLKDIIARDIRDGQYFVTGDLTRSIYREDCKFKDPTNVTVGVANYLAALGFLFDPQNSKHELLEISVTSGENGKPEVFATWRLGGYLRFPWRPRVVPFTGSTRYVFDDDGLVALHDEQWSISPITALLETITPTFGPTQLL